jgi:aspartyl/asparaginyl beta-hydroxylase (cupin superfamily)
MTTQAASAVDLNTSAGRALAAGDTKTARTLLEQAVQAAPKNPLLWLNLAGAHRAAGDLDAALAAVESSLRIEPRLFLGLLMKGSLLEQQGQPKPAVLVYGRALNVAPPDQRLDPSTLKAVQRARQLHRQHVMELGAYIRQELGAALGSDTAEDRRVQLFVEATLGTRRIYRQQPTDFLYPGLPAIEFWERREFPWLEELEAATGTIRNELMQVLKEDAGFEPYVAYADTVPLDQWAELNHSLKWSAFHFYHYGKRYEDNCRRCPQTLAALAAVPQPQVQRRMPAAMFSVLKPKTRIPPHTGVANVRLVVHLPLIVPEGCAFRVGNETRPWREGQAWVFDDTIEHEAWNDSEQVRVILICDVWNPRLSAHERELITAVLTCMDRFNETVPESGL